MKALFSLLLLSLALAACGQKGPLYLPASQAPAALDVGAAA